MCTISKTPGHNLARHFACAAMLVLASLLAACATRPAPRPPVADLLHDAYFEPSRVRIDAQDIFAMSDAMRRYAATELAGRRVTGAQDPRHALLDALYTHGSLHLRYDAGDTRNAAQAFDARAGNCLSLVIMTGAFARTLGLPVSFQRVRVPESYSRSGDVVFASGHVNLVLGPRQSGAFQNWSLPSDLVVDFLPGAELGAVRTEALEERTIVAMYFNNRAAEALADGRLADSYAWARAAVLHDPGLGAALNTLAVLYLRTGHAADAETALRRVLIDEPDNPDILSNLVTALRRQDRSGEATALALRLSQIQPHPPFHSLDLGRQALAAGDFRRARELFSQELKQQPDQPEVHFWAALADWRLGDRAGAARHLRLARDFSTTLAAHDLYAAKLARLHALHVE